jgi:lipoprotein-anchoring transpeptidase ErfK/SrfK
MWKVPCLTVFLLAAAALDARAQQHSPSSSSVVTSAVTGATFVVEARASDSGIQRISTAERAASKNTDAQFRLDGFTTAQLRVLEKLNRVNASRLKRLSAIVIPADWSDDELTYSPFPLTYAWATDKPKTIVVDQAAQAFGAYEFGRLVRWGPISSGELGQTPSGIFHLSWRSRGHRSSIDPSWYLPWYFNFVPSRGIAFHQYSLPGRAASHGCVRLLERDAIWLYNWGEATTRSSKGTTVVVLNCPDSARPWQTGDFLRTGVILPAAPDATTQSCTASAGRASASYRKALR